MHNLPILLLIISNEQGGALHLLCIVLRECVIAEWPRWFVFERRLKVVKMAETDKKFQNGSKWSKLLKCSKMTKILKVTEIRHIVKISQNGYNREPLPEEGIFITI